MIVVVGYLTIDPAKRDEAEAALIAAMAATRTEDGNIDYRFSTDLLDPNRINCVEQWEDQASIDAHMTHPNLAEFMTAIGPCVSGPLGFVGYEISSSTTIM